MNDDAPTRTYIQAQPDLFLVYWDHQEGSADGLMLHISRVIAWTPIAWGSSEVLCPVICDEEGREGLGFSSGRLFDEREHQTVLGVYHASQIGQDVFDECYHEKLGMGMLTARRERMETILHARAQREAGDHVVRLERDPTKRRPDDGGF